MDRYIGKRLEGRYDILELIGKGGMANVYRAFDIIDERTVAVKILRDEYMTNADFVRRFKNESKAIALLNHPNIVRVYDVSFSDTQSIVMEYIDGVSLKEYIDHTGALPWKDALHFTTQILHALQHAHDNGIVHRDIKPQNIMLLRSGEIKVTDFGIARFARAESVTISDRAIGSVHYISPEQALGEYTDDKTDIYATGIMLYEMLTGELPFEADTAVSVAIQQIQSPIEPPSLTVPEIPKGLDEITLYAAQKDPKDRYQSAAEMIAALDQFYQNPSIVFNYATPVKKQQESEIETKTKPLKLWGKRQGRSSVVVPSKADKNKQRSSYLRILLVVTIAVIIGSAGFIGITLYMDNPFVQTATTRLPNLIGKPISDVEEMHPNFTFIISERSYSDEYNKDVIFDQKPNAGMQVKDGSTVQLWVSDGIREVTIPELSDIPAARVENELRDLGVEPVPQRIYHEDIVAGRVISTDPPAGTTVEGGREVTIYISQGPERKMMNVPDVINLSEANAKQLIEDREFVVAGVTSESSALPEGTVIRQIPSPGSLELQGTPISLVISQGGLKNYTIPVQLPTNMDRDVSVRARVGGGERPDVGAEEVLNPAQSATGIWSPAFSGAENDVLTISIYVDGVLYQEYELNFKEGSHTKVRDRSSAPEFQQ